MNSSIKFKNRDIEKYKEEYDLFVEVKNDYVPAFMIVDGDDTSKSGLYAPDQDYETLEEALNIIKEKL